jgi:hypothetical protein
METKEMKTIARVSNQHHYFYVTDFGGVMDTIELGTEFDDRNWNESNYFNSEEEALNSKIRKLILAKNEIRAWAWRNSDDDFLHISYGRPRYSGGKWNADPYYKEMVINSSSFYSFVEKGGTPVNIFMDIRKDPHQQLEESRRYREIDAKF